MTTGTTEKEALTKWCPFTRVGIYVGPALAAVNRRPSDGTDRPDIQSETRCLGSACMVWRWIDALREKPEALSRGWPAIVDAEDDDDFADVQKRPAAPRPDDLPASWIEVPLSGSHWIDADGGFWQEPEAERDARWQIGCDKREGRCRLAGGAL